MLGNKQPALQQLLMMAVVCLLPGVAYAQASVQALIDLTSVSPGRVRVALDFGSPQREWSFRNAYGPIVGLTERFERVSAFGQENQPVSVERAAPGHYRTSEDVTHLEYEVAILVPARRADMSHISWVNSERGLLMLADLLPEFPDSNELRVRLHLPPSWTATSGLKEAADGYFAVVAPEQVVFLVGPASRLLTRRIEGDELQVAISGKWPFADRDVLKAAARVAEEYAQVTGAPLPEGANLMLLPYASGSGPTLWTAETRGNSVVLLMKGDEAPRQLLARLTIILSHEILHLWVPNALRMHGDYDWFFEGFTLYQALITSLRFRLIDFDEYLRTLARVYDSYLSSLDRDRWSLLALSERRWTSSSSLLNDKGMLVAMIYDLGLRAMTDGKIGISSLYARLFQSPPPGSVDANEVIIALLDQPTGMSGFSSTFVSKPRSLDLHFLLSPYGINVERSGFSTRFVVSKPLPRTQEKLLRSIGYRR